MKERPILFSSAMVRAILEGRKFQTRRVIKPQPERNADGLYHVESKPRSGYGSEKVMRDFLPLYCPYGKEGDHLWVRETWKPWPNTAGPELRGPDDMGAIYQATWDKSGGHGWKPSIHMPRWASRITLEVVRVRVERVRDISAADCIAEGVWHRDWSVVDRNAQRAFGELWNKINGPRGYSWESNPWVWCIEFRRIAP